jgi:hypothetical protein
MRRLLILPLLLLSANAHAGSSLHFDGNDDHVTMGVATDLALATFTLECWFRWDGAGDTAGTGTGGINAYPLVAKGRGESDGGPQDMNYLLGVLDSGVLAADFEDMAEGLNHPVMGFTDVTDGDWHHAAVTFDGQDWALFLDGQEEVRQSTAGAQPRSDSEQHFSVGTAMNTSGSASGHFRGAIDEVRVWDVARTGAEIFASANTPSTGVEPGLVGRWGFDEGAGDRAADSVGELDGDIVGATWTGDAPFDLDAPPDLPVLVSPAMGATDVSLYPVLQVQVSDPEGADLAVQFFGRVRDESAERFTLVNLPDTQYYSCECNGGVPETFTAQTSWIVQEREALNVACVAHVGDIVDHGDSYEEEWINADAALSLLEDPQTTGLAEGIPYSVAVGNHDQGGGGAAGPTEFFNQYFGVERFEDRGYYGGHFGDDNDNHYILFTAGGLDFVVLSLEYDTVPDGDVLDWAGDVLDEHSDRRAILISHYLLGTDGAFSSQGLLTYEALKNHPNLFLMMAGHLTGESARVDTHEGNSVYTLLADYQFRDNGGDGWLRILEFSPSDDEIHVQTWSPTRGEFETDTDSEFVLSYAMSDEGFEPLGDPTTVQSGQTVSITWPDLATTTPYQWFVEVDDGQTVRSEVFEFTTGDGTTPADDDDDDFEGPGDDDCAATNGSAGGCECTLPAHSRPGRGILLTLILITLFGARSSR